MPCAILSALPGDVVSVVVTKCGENSCHFCSSRVTSGRGLGNNNSGSNSGSIRRWNRHRILVIRKIGELLLAIEVCSHEQALEKSGNCPAAPGGEAAWRHVVQGLEYS
jgi:hypothetical protein